MKDFLLYLEPIFPMIGVLTNTDMSNILKIVLITRISFTYAKIKPVLLEVIVSYFIEI